MPNNERGSISLTRTNKLKMQALVHSCNLLNSKDVIFWTLFQDVSMMYVDKDKQQQMKKESEKCKLLMRKELRETNK